MNTPQEYSQRFQTVATKREMTPVELYPRVDINRSRLGMIWNGKAKPGVDEEAKLAHAMQVNVAVLQSDTALKVWLRLIEEKSPEMLLPKVLSRLTEKGQRGADSLEASDDLIYAVVDEVIQEAIDPPPEKQQRLF